MVYFDVECVVTLDSQCMSFMHKFREMFSTSWPQNSSLDPTQAQVLPLHRGNITNYVIRMHSTLYSTMSCCAHQSILLYSLVLYYRGANWYSEYNVLHIVTCMHTGSGTTIVSYHAKYIYVLLLVAYIFFCPLQGCKLSCNGRITIATVMAHAGTELYR